MQFKVAAKTENKLILALREGLSQIHIWLEANRLLIHLGKSTVVVYDCSKSYYQWIQDLSLGEIIVPGNAEVKYLGVYIDETLSFRKHTEVINVNIFHNVGMLQKLQNILPFEIICMLYFSLVHPYCFYCYAVWSNTFFLHLRALCVLQNSAIQILSRIHSHLSVREINEKVRVVPVFDYSFTIMLN